jgi:hypothetical protein
LVFLPARGVKEEAGRPEDKPARGRTMRNHRSNEPVTNSSYIPLHLQWREMRTLLLPISAR